MNPLKRAIRLVLWLIAAGLILIGGLNLGLEFMRHRVKGTDLSVVRCALWSLPVALGGLLFFKAGAIASRLTDDFDDD